MDIAKYFIIAFFLSALGTLPIGLITLTIVQKTIEKGKTAGWQVALGATIMEFVYTLIALYGLRVFSLDSSWKYYIQIGTFFLFLILGIYFIQKPLSTPNKRIATNHKFEFIQGIGIGMMNMLIVPFWLFVGVWLESNGLTFENKWRVLWFSVGASLGALLVFVLYIEGSYSILQKHQKLVASTNRIIGYLFFVLAAVQLFQFL